MKIPFITAAFVAVELVTAGAILPASSPASAASSPLATPPAQSEHLVYVPMIFRAEAQAIRTTACLQITERIYAQPNWIEGTSDDGDALDRAIKNVIAAMKRKDRAALLQLSDPTQGRDTKNFDEQAGAYFQQFGAIDLIEVPRAYVFDSLAVFFTKLRAGGQTIFAPFAFAYETDGSLGFLPSRPEKVTFLLLQDWFNSKSGPATTDNPTYCADKDVQSARYGVSLVPSPSSVKQGSQPAKLLLRGAPIDMPGELNNLAGRVKSTFDQLKSALAGNTIDDFLKHLTPEGGSRLKQWFDSATEAERNQYRKAIVEQQPFFVFDASPVVIVYTRSPSRVVQVMYFTSSSGNELLWTNSSRVTVADQVFKKGPLYNAASLDKPFSNVSIK